MKIFEISPKSSSSTGRWTPLEHDLFIKGINLFGNRWQLVSKLIGTRSSTQVRTHAQKYFIKQNKIKQVNKIISKNFENLTKESQSKQKVEEKKFADSEVQCNLQSNYPNISVFCTFQYFDQGPI